MRTLVRSVLAHPGTEQGFRYSVEGGGVRTKVNDRLFGGVPPFNAARNAFSGTISTTRWLQSS